MLQWFLRLCNWVKLFPQSEHWNTRPLVCVSRCFSIHTNVLNRFPHTEQTNISPSTFNGRWYPDAEEWSDSDGSCLDNSLESPLWTSFSSIALGCGSEGGLSPSFVLFCTSWSPLMSTNSGSGSADSACSESTFFGSSLLSAGIAPTGSGGLSGSIVFFCLSWRSQGEILPPSVAAPQRCCLCPPGVLRPTWRTRAAPRVCAQAPPPRSPPHRRFAGPCQPRPETAGDQTKPPSKPSTV